MTKKKQILRKLNEAFAESNIDFLIENVTDDIEWTAVGDFSVKGKEQFIKTMEKIKSDDPFKLEIENIITHGNSAAVNGKMTSSKGERYAFCDVHTFSGFKEPKIKKMISYVVELDND